MKHLRPSYASGSGCILPYPSVPAPTAAQDAQRAATLPAGPPAEAAEAAEEAPGPGRARPSPEDGTVWSGHGGRGTRARRGRVGRGTRRAGGHVPERVRLLHNLHLPRRGEETCRAESSWLRRAGGPTHRRPRSPPACPRAHPAPRPAPPAAAGRPPSPLPLETEGRGATGRPFRRGAAP